MELFLILLSAMIAGFLLLNGLRANGDSVTGRDRVTALAALMLPLAALIVDNRVRGVWDREEWALFAVAVLLIVGGIALVTSERRRGRPIRRGHGLLSMLTGVVLVLMVASVPVIAAAIGLQDDEVDPAEAEISTYDRAVSIFDNVTQLVGEEANLDAETVALRMDTGETVAQLVRANDGDLERVIQGVSEILTGQVEILAANGDMTDTVAAIAIAQMENVVRVGVEQELAGLLERFDAGDRPEGEAAPEG